MVEKFKNTSTPVKVILVIALAFIFLVIIIGYSNHQHEQELKHARYRVEHMDYKLAAKLLKVNGWSKVSSNIEEAGKNDNSDLYNKSKLDKSTIISAIDSEGYQDVVTFEPRSGNKVKITVAVNKLNDEGSDATLDDYDNAIATEGFASTGSYGSYVQDTYGSLVKHVFTERATYHYGTLKGV